jgi:hypothetical protein
MVDWSGYMNGPDYRGLVQSQEKAVNAFNAGQDTAFDQGLKRDANAQAWDANSRAWDANSRANAQESRTSELHPYVISKEQFEQGKRAQDLLGEYGSMAQDAQTPEEWAHLKESMRQRGIDVSKFDDENWQVGKRRLQIMTGDTSRRLSQALAQAKVQEQTAQATKNTAEAEALTRKTDDPVDELIRMNIERMKQAQAQRNGGTAPPMQQRLSPTPTQPGPRLIPQSMEGGETPDASDPNLIKTQVSAPQAAPQAQAAPSPSKTVSTPFGDMDVEQAKQLAFALNYKGKHQAAKMIEDSLNNGQPEKSARTELDKQKIGYVDQLGRLGQIAASFDPKYLELSNRMKMTGASWGSKIGMPLNPNDERSLQDFARFKQASIENLNRLLKEMSGTAVSAQEYTRMTAANPNAGTGIFDGDDPVSFRAKLMGSIANVKLAIARNNYMRDKFAGSVDELAQQMPLDNMKKIIDQRGAELEQQLRQANPKVDPKQIDEAVRQKLKGEFGI